MRFVLSLGLTASLLLLAAEARAEPRLRVSSTKPRVGDPVLVTIDGVGADKAPTGSGGQVALVFYPVKRGWQAVFAVPLDDKAGDLKVTIDSPALSQVLAVQPRTWEEEKIDIAPELAEPGAKERKVIDDDNEKIIGALKEISPPLFTGKFVKPGGTKMTSSFGSWRTINGDYRSRHLGLDFGASKGSRVRAAQAGKVTLVHSGFLTGATVVLNHGAGISSVYFHLDDYKVAVGDTVKRGQVIATVGLTGRTTGPHIHLGVWVAGGFVDPAAFLRLKIRAPKVAAPAKTKAKGTAAAKKAKSKP